MRRAAVDANQAEVVAALRDVGASVMPLHTVGRGCPDLLVGFRSLNLLLEVKDGSKPPSARALTGPQVKWHQEWRGSVSVVTSVSEALRVLGVGSYADLHRRFVEGRDE